MGKDKDKKDRKDKKRKRSKEDDEEERRSKAEKLAKKVAKHLKKHGEGAGHGYTNDTNPFGDSNVQERFVWGKKIEKQLQSGVDVRELTSKAERQRQIERLEEIEKVKKRRAEREAERARQEEEAGLLQRERAVAEAVELEKKEELFHLEQAVKRAEHRLVDGRPEPIDLLVKNLHLADQFEVAPEPPYEVFHGLTLQEVRGLQEDIQEFLELDVHNTEHVEFWKAIDTVCTAELQEAIRQDEIDRARMRGEPPPAKYLKRETGVHGSVHADVQMMLAGKTFLELEELEIDIQRQLETGSAADPEYWAAVLKDLTIQKAKAQLREIHTRILRKHVDSMRLEHDGVDVAEAMGWEAEARREKEPAKDHAGEQAGSEAELEAQAETEAAGDTDMGEPGPSTAAAAAVAAPVAEESESEEEEEDNTGQWSPRPLDPEHVIGQDVIPEDDDRALLDLMRAQVKYKEAAKFKAAAAAGGTGSAANQADRLYQQMISDPGRGGGGVHPMFRYIADAAPQRGEAAMRSGAVQPLGEDAASVQRFEAQASRLMGDMAAEGDLPFGGEVQMESQVYWWHDKYRPRKPKYFNRVHTGYEWNKYNQTHYDHDNPPPKVVQGYKFNIFYPDLIDKNTAPTYSTDKDPQADEHGSTCLLRFHAGPPYEDISFRIVNKEWEYSHKKGFKCTFERGIMHLYINFKRQRYRR
ncbi:hypothetical protein WJX72_002023 [[Myrmecia] bisecta]|uniref:Splicing factor Cactin n=1 Tax=[Myrmecia] bisecta TaxID=41462 RepID=A0AAW1PCG6_9CHLO